MPQVGLEPKMATNDEDGGDDDGDADDDDNDDDGDRQATNW